MMIHLNDSEWVKSLRKRFGIEKPEWFTLDDEDDFPYSKWEKETKANHPVGYFFTETVPDWIMAAYKFVTHPYYSTRYYIRNRFIRKTHVLRTDCPIGTYWETDERILSGLANAIVDYVEIELAYKSLWCGTNESKTAVWKNGRCPELGLEYLAWEMTLDDKLLDEYSRSDVQAASAREIKAIYDWVKTRDARPDPHDISGWSAYCEKYSGSLWKKETPEQLAECNTALEKVREIEKQYEEEDQDMLIRIIKIRKNLWA